MKIKIIIGLCLLFLLIGCSSVPYEDREAFCKEQLGEYAFSVPDSSSFYCHVGMYDQEFIVYKTEKDFNEMVEDLRLNENCTRI